MDITDFTGLFKYKLIIPTVYVISWALMFIGPAFFPIIYQYCSLAAIGYITMKVLMMSVISVCVAIKSWKVLNMVEYPYEYRNESLSHLYQEITHAFIIPSYKEDIDLLAETLEVLAKHNHAKQYLIFLAMEAHEVDSDKKAYELIYMFKGKFRLMHYTLHMVKEHYQKGKASNVSWCAYHMYYYFIQHNIDENKVFLTIIDADSWAPNIYIYMIDEHVQNNYDNRYKSIFQPTQCFTRNHLDVPVMSRTYDMMHSAMHYGNLQSLFDITFSLSNYTLSFNLIKRIGFWDTCADAIGEDYHTVEKCYWKTDGDIICVPIFAMFNQLNISTGKGYCADMKARFWQAERHAQGIADVAYNLRMLMNKPLRLRTLILAYETIEIFILPAIVPWMVFSMNFQQQIMFIFSKPPAYMLSGKFIGYISNLFTILSVIQFVSFEMIKRRSTRLLHGLENYSLLRVLEYPIMFVLNMTFVSIPTFILAAFGILFDNREYVVAEKVVDRKAINN